MLANELQLSVIAIEYPGYGLYRGDPDSKKIQTDREMLILFLQEIGYKLNNMYLFGRSIGTGPATYLAAKYHVACLILMSPYTSI